MLTSLSGTVLLQSFRTHDVPAWIGQCQDSVRRYAGAQNWDYRFEGDELFDRAPDWVRQGAATNVCGLSDICRLEWMREALGKWDRVIWADIDLLVIDPGQITIPDHSFGFAYELAFVNGAPRPGINNAFMFFRRGSDMLGTYLERCYEILRAGGGPDGCDRTAIGPDLLRGLGVPQSHVIEGLNILNVSDLYGLYRTPLPQMPGKLRAMNKIPVGAANLCLNERTSFEGKARALYDQILDTVCTALLEMPKNVASLREPLDGFAQDGSISRNQLCPCGSNLRYKHCHGMQQ